MICSNSVKPYTDPDKRMHWTTYMKLVVLGCPISVIGYVFKNQKVIKENKLIDLPFYYLMLRIQPQRGDLLIEIGDKPIIASEERHVQLNHTGRSSGAGTEGAINRSPLLGFDTVKLPAA